MKVDKGVADLELTKLRALATEFLGTEAPELSLLEQIALLVTAITERCRHEGRRRLIDQLVDSALVIFPTATEGLTSRLGQLSIDELSSLGELLDNADRTRTALEKAASDLTSALGSGDYAAMASLALEADSHKNALAVASTEFVDRIGSNEDARSDPPVTADSVSVSAPSPTQASSATPSPQVHLSMVPAIPEAPTNILADVGPHPVSPVVVKSEDEATYHGAEEEPQDVLIQEEPPNTGEEPLPKETSEPSRTVWPASAAEDSFWSALRQQRLGAAKGLLDLGVLDERACQLLMPALSMTAAALTSDGNGEVDDRARAWTEEALAAWQGADETSPVNLSAGVLLLPATMLLALLAPGSNPSGLLNALVYNAPRLGQLLPAIRDMARHELIGAQVLPGPRLLADLVSEERWQEELAAHSQKVRQWLDGQQASQIRFAGATDVWRAMLRPDGPLGPLLTAAANDEVNRVNQVRERLGEFRFHPSMRAAEQKVRGKAVARTHPIHDKALRELEQLGEEAVQLVRAWIALRNRAPADAESARNNPAAEFRNFVIEKLPTARSELAGLGDPIMASMAPLAGAVLDRLAAVLGGINPDPNRPSLLALLGRDLLPLPVEFGPDFTLPEPLRPDLLPHLVRLIGGGSEAFDLANAARARLTKRDFLGASLAVGLLPSQSPEAAELGQQVRNLAQAERVAALAELETMRAQVEEAERAGRLDAGDTQRLIAVFDACRVDIEHAEPASLSRSLLEARERSDETADALHSAAGRVRERIRLRLSNLTSPVDQAIQGQIDEAIKSGQFAIAEDIVERLDDGIGLEEYVEPPPVAARFDAFFPGRTEAIAGWLRTDRGRGIERLRDLMSSAKSFPDALGATPIPADAKELLSAWRECAGVRGELGKWLVSLMNALGFTEPALPGFRTPTHSVTEAMFRLEVRPLRQRETAILPEFGSVAGGNYRILCLWQKRDADDIAEALSRARLTGGPVIVLFFGILDSEQRRRLAGMARSARLRNALVLDDVLVAYLATLTEARLFNMFACTIPFTDSRPWADAGTPAPEMFFGRGRELRAVEAIAGEFTQLLYGGRQLGKTAVLRQVERDAAGSRDIIARYISIAQIGLTQPPEELWRDLTEGLAKAGVAISAPRRGQVPGSAFRSQVLEWLAQYPSRRILLLLDEADSFFARDREAGFPVTEVFRTMSVETDRRFKPVFAGLRNVQQLARDPNTPFAHMGRALVVGPLIRGHERREADALVRWPFAALGFRLESAVVTRILSVANYYPSLIQVVCQRLLHNLRQRAGGMGPPWKVEIEDVEKVLATREVRDAAFERFRITLELDQRYNLVALLSAQFSMDDPELLANGIEIGILRDLAAIAWPAGFPPEPGDDAFSALLSEMEGLGILRRVDGTHYALRSHNLLHLLGTRQEIDYKIALVAKHGGPTDPDPLEYRRMVADQPSVLTACQESELLAERNGALLIAGIQAAGIDRCQSAIEAAARFTRDRYGLDVKFQRSQASDIYSFAREVETLAKRNDTGLFLLFVACEQPWDAEWIKEAHRLLSVKDSAKRSNKTIFVADAAKAWSCVASDDTREHLAAVPKLTVGPWSHDTLRLWLTVEDRDSALPDWLKLDRDALLAGTGGWDAALHTLFTTREKLDRCSPEDLSSRLQHLNPSEGDFLADIIALPDAVHLLTAIAEAEDSREPDDQVDAEFVSLMAEASAGFDPSTIVRQINWAEWVGAITHGRNGIICNKLLRAELPRLRAAIAA